MADFEKFADRLLVLEGKYVNNANDKGGPTKYGVILSTWKTYGYDKNGDGKIDAEDIKLLTPLDAKTIAKKVFWDYFNADKIKNQSIAELIVDWAYNSGRATAARKVQILLKGSANGFFELASVDLINNANEVVLFNAIKKARKDFYNNIVNANPSQRVFFHGWMNRLDKLTFRPTDTESK